MMFQSKKFIIKHNVINFVGLSKWSVLNINSNCNPLNVFPGGHTTSASSSSANPTSTTEIIFSNGTSRLGPNLQVPVYFHCAVLLADYDVLIIGGQSALGDSDSSSTDSTSYGSNTYIINMLTGEYTNGPRLTYGR